MLAELGETDPEYVAMRTGQWGSDVCYSWAVCEPTTGELLAEVIVDPVAQSLHSGHGRAMTSPRRQRPIRCADSPRPRST